MRQLYSIGKRSLLDRSFRATVYQTLVRLEEPTRKHLHQLETIYSSPLPVDVSVASEARFVVLLPNLQKQHMFGGVATALKFAAALVRSGTRVRMLAMDQTIDRATELDLHDYLRNQCGLEQHIVDTIDVASVKSVSAPGHPGDVFLATTWWSARRVAQTLEGGEFESGQFYYLVQDFEPGFYPWSDEYALAVATYRFNCVPLVNTTFLADHLTKETGIKVNPEYVFRPEIDWQLYSPASAAEIRSRQKRKIFLYGRPGVPRNLFGIAIMGLRRFIEHNGLTSVQLEVVSAGEAHVPISLGGNIQMRGIGKLSLEEYAEELRSCDIGLSLMLSPHPSYPPFEMAASGLSVVACEFSGKRMDFSDNFISTEPTPEGVARSLSIAYTRSSDADARIAGAKYDVSHLGRELEDVARKVRKELW